jgi:hypothetical protein
MLNLCYNSFNHVKSNKKRFTKVSIVFKKITNWDKKEVQIDLVTIRVKKEEKDIHY